MAIRTENPKRHGGTRAEGSVFDALFEAEDAANLRVRAELMDSLIAYAERRALSQNAAAERFGVSQGRVSELVNGKIGRFTIDALVNMHAAAGIRVRVVTEDDRFTEE